MTKIYSGLFFMMTVLQAASGQDKRTFLRDFAAVQYAGSIGFLSAGIGYDIFKKKATAGLYYGYVPPAHGGHLHIVSTRLLFNTWSFNLSDKLKFQPLSAGVMVTYHFGEQFRSQWPDHQYPQGYYWWRTSLRTHINTQTSLSQTFEGKFFSSITCYVDLNVSELYLVSFLQNHRSLSAGEIIKVGYGIRLNF